MRFSGKVAIVTGAGSGIGRAIAEKLAAEGAVVAVVDVVKERVDNVVSALSSRGLAAEGYVVDVSVKDQVERMIEEVVSRHGRVDILVNNAGIMDGFTPVAEVSDELWERVLRVNLYSAFYTTRKVIPIMLKQGGGVIINISSVAALFGGFAGTPYTVSKAALIGLTRSIAAYYGSKGIRCNAVLPGAVKTAIGFGPVKPNEEGLEYTKKLSIFMLRPPAEPEEIANVVTFLASDEAVNINGAVIVVDGGWTVF